MATTVAAPVIEINAPLQTVWEILDDFERYPEWNPLTVHARTNRVVGETILLEVRMGASYHTIEKEVLKAYQPPHKLAWGGKFPAWLLVATRWQELEALDAHCTRYTNYETFSGPLEPLAMRFYRRSIEQGFTDMSQALKRRAESIYQP
jgi:hypothetical protein